MLSNRKRSYSLKLSSSSDVVFLIVNDESFVGLGLEGGKLRQLDGMLGKTVGGSVGRSFARYYVNDLQSTGQ